MLFKRDKIQELLLMIKSCDFYVVLLASHQIAYGITSPPVLTLEYNNRKIL